MPPEGLAQLAAAYDAAVDNAAPEDVKVGSSTTRVSGFINCPEFDVLYLHPPLIDACRPRYQRAVPVACEDLSAHLRSARGPL